jgi:probable rRNA maturation factor
MNELVVRHGRGPWRVGTRALRQLARRLLEDALGLRHYSLAVHLVSGQRIAALNRRWLGHDGVTDVIAFDYRMNPPELDLHGEIFLCPEEAVRQARRYRTTREAELARYLVHGVLHLIGYRDRNPTSRRRMKRREDRLLRHLHRVGEREDGMGTIDFRPVRGEPWRQS